MPDQQSNTHSDTGRMLAVALVIAACSLRAPITGVGSLVSTIRDALGISGGAAGMLTTIPLLVFAALSILVGRWAGRVDAGRILLLGLALLSVGIAVRSSCGTFGLFAGTAVIGAGICIGNVLVPALVKEYYPGKVGKMTSAYSTGMSAFAGLSSAASVPLAMRIGWKMALFVWIILTLTAFFFWLPHRGRRLGRSGRVSGEQKLSKDCLPPKRRSVARDPMSWWITFYMGVQSLLFFTLVAWFATIVQSFGFDKASAGYFNAAYLLMGIPGSFVTPLIAGRRKNQTGLGLALGMIYVTGIGSLLLVGGTAGTVIAVLTCGFCTGGCISYAMALFGLHTKNAADTSALSGLAQSVGYLMAAFGPFLIGKVFDLTGGWEMPLSILFVLTFVMAFLAVMAGREKIINEDC